MRMDRNEHAHHVYMRYVAWSVTIAFFIWFIRTGELVALLLGIVGVLVTLGEELYLRMSVERVTKP